MSTWRSVVFNKLLDPFGLELVVCMQHLPCSVCFWCMRGGSVEVCKKNISNGFIKGLTHLGMPRGA